MWISANREQIRTEFNGFGTAWAAAAECRPDAFAEALKLSPEDRARLVAAGTWYASEHPLPMDARHSVRVALDVDGLPVDPDGPDVITQGTLDHCWTYGDELGRLVAVVRDDKTGVRPVPHPSVNLQTAAYLVWWMSETMADVGEVEIVNPVLQTFERHPFTGSELDSLWAQIVAKVQAYDANRPEYNTAAGCDECLERSRCPAHLLPAMKGAKALEPFTKPDGLTPSNISKAWLTVDAMEEVVNKAKKLIRSYVAEHGTVELADGRRLGFIECKGRESLDRAALERDGIDLSKYTSRGEGYRQLRPTRGTS